VLQVKRVALRRGDDILPGDVMVAALSLRVNQLNEISIQNYSLTSAGVRELVSAIKARARAVSWGCARWIGGGNWPWALGFPTSAAQSCLMHVTLFDYKRAHSNPL